MNTDQCQTGTDQSLVQRSVDTLTVFKVANVIKYSQDVFQRLAKVFKHFWLVEVFWRSEISFLKFDWSFFDFVKYLKWNFLELDKCSKSKYSQTLQKWCDSKMTRDVTNLVSSSLHLRWHFWCDITDFALFLGIFKMNCEILF